MTWQDKLKNNLTEAPREKVIRCLALGHAGAGKTVFAGSFPTPLWINTDFGLTSVTDKDKLKYVINFEKGENIYADVMGVIRELKAKTGPFAPGGQLADVKTLVIDSVSKLSSFLLHEIQLKLNQNPTKDKPGYEGYGLLKHLLEDISLATASLPVNVVMTAGLTVEKNDLTGEVITLPDLDGSYRTAIAKDFDEVYLFEPQQSGLGVKYFTYTAQYKTYQGLKTRSNMDYRVENLNYEVLKKKLFEKA
jgi:hypothetical protein